MKGPSIRFGIRWDDGRRPKRSLLSLAVATTLLGSGAGAAHARPMPLAPAPVDVVVVASPSRMDAVQRLTERLGGTVTRRLAIVDGFTASVPRRSLKRLETSRSVRAVSRDGGLRVSGTDPGAEAAAGSSKLLQTATGVEALNASGFDGSGVGVALLDSGVVALEGLGRPGAVVDGPDFSEEGADPDLAGLDTFGHGSHLAGLIAGHDPLTGFEGLAPGARVVSVKVAGADGVTSLERVLEGMEWVRAHRDDPGLNIRVLNLSLGSDDELDYRRDILAWAAERLWKDGIAVIAAAGNDGSEARVLDMPAADPYVIAVGATATQDTGDPSDDRVAEFSSRSAVRPPDIVAPGTNVVSLRVPGSTLDGEFPGARVGEDFFRGSGTSQAAAVVSALAARLLAQRPELTNDQLKALLVAGAVDLADPASADGAGRVDAARSAALQTPDGGDAAQRWPAAAPDVRRALTGKHGKGPRAAKKEYDTGATQWAGRRWSGMKWSGRRWSGMKWSGMKWSGMKWSGAGWDDAPAG